MNPCHLYNYCLGPKPSKYVLKKILWEEKSIFGLYSLSFLFFFKKKKKKKKRKERKRKLILLPDLLFAELATKYSKDKYACVKGMKNEPLSQLTSDLKKRKLNEGKGETTARSSIFGTPSSPTPSLEMMTFIPPTTRSKEKSKAGKSIWENLATALGQAHNIITDNELRGLSFTPSHELVSCHIHKLV